MGWRVLSPEAGGSLGSWLALLGVEREELCDFFCPPVAPRPSM